MGLESVTQQQIDELITMEKRVTNPNTRGKIKGAHSEKNYKIVDLNGENSFNLFVRINNIFDNDFSCGLLWYMPSGEILTLTRYNGSSHAHKNSLEKELLAENFHIHKALEKYISAGKKAEGFAEETDRYQTPQGALECLILDCNIGGFSDLDNQGSLF